MDALALTETASEQSGMHGGSTSLRKWTRSQRIRTAAEIGISADVVDPADPPTRGEIAPKALRLHNLGMTYGAIAEALGVSEKTVSRVVRAARASST